MFETQVEKHLTEQADVYLQLDRMEADEFCKLAQLWHNFKIFKKISKNFQKISKNYKNFDKKNA